MTDRPRTDEERLNRVLFAWETRVEGITQPDHPLYTPPLQQSLLALLRDVRREENEAIAVMLETFAGADYRSAAKMVRARMKEQDHLPITAYVNEQMRKADAEQQRALTEDMERSLGIIWNVQTHETTGPREWEINMRFDDEATFERVKKAIAETAAPPLTWTREIPTKPGIYWTIHEELCNDAVMEGNQLTPGCIEILSVEQTRDGRLFMACDDEDCAKWRWFYGPLPIERPAPPKEEEQAP